MLNNYLEEDKKHKEADEFPSPLPAHKMNTDLSQRISSLLHQIASCQSEFCPEELQKELECLRNDLGEWLVGGAEGWQTINSILEKAQIEYEKGLAPIVPMRKEDISNEDYFCELTVTGDQKSLKYLTESDLFRQALGDRYRKKPPLFVFISKSQICVFVDKKKQVDRFLKLLKVSKKRRSDDATKSLYIFNCKLNSDTLYLEFELNFYSISNTDY